MNFGDPFGLRVTVTGPQLLALVNSLMASSSLFAKWYAILNGPAAKQIDYELRQSTAATIMRYTANQCVRNGFCVGWTDVSMWGEGKGISLISGENDLPSEEVLIHEVVHALAKYKASQEQSGVPTKCGAHPPSGGWDKDCDDWVDRVQAELRAARAKKPQREE